MNLDLHDAQVCTHSDNTLVFYSKNLPRCPFCDANDELMALKDYVRLKGSGFDG